MNLKKERKKKEINLGCTWETTYLVYQYRIFKSIEHGARKFSPNFDKISFEELNGDYKLAQDVFISYTLDKEPSLAHDCFKNDKTGIFASLYRILQKEGLLEEAIARSICLKLKGNEDKDIINKYASHLRYYINHPDIWHEYKFTKRNYLRDMEESIKPTYDKLIHVLKNKGHLKVTEKEEVDKFLKLLKEHDDKFIIRSLALEDFFNSEEGKKLKEEDKIDIALRVGALDSSFLYYYDEEGNLVD